MAKKQRNKPIDVVPRYHMPLPQMKGCAFDGGFLLAMQLHSKVGFSPVDISLTADDVIVSVALPGAAPHKVQITVTEGALTVSGDVEPESHDQKQKWQLEEIPQGACHRSLNLSAEVNPDKAKATQSKNGGQDGETNDS